MDSLPLLRNDRVTVRDTCRAAQCSDDENAIVAGQERGQAGNAQNLTPKPAAAVALSGSTDAGLPGEPMQRLPALAQEILADVARRLRSELVPEIAELRPARFSMLACRFLAANLEKGRPGRRRHESIDRAVQDVKAGKKWKTQMDYERYIEGYSSMNGAEKNKARRALKSAMRYRRLKEKQKRAQSVEGS